MKHLIFTFSLLAIFAPIAQAQDRLEWSDTRKLTVNDFKATPPDPSTNQSLIAHFGFELNLKNLKKEELEKLKTFNQYVVHFLMTDESWINWTDKSRLRYVITLFDLNEWMARELRKRLIENRQLVLAGQYKTVQEEVRLEFEKIHQDYDVETNYGNNLLEQTTWETRINEEILGLADFCKSCSTK